ncbi:hypothetical protein OUZ56_019139 [Daphnia magna]|uniref:THAP-type domain-containing protein n=1 Tax=Daphnia magna TaxID=35525 RepID=A0ABQ9ZAR9_9CRUS|nr:hypothetical protein OUZ56_019139 [Daphnia magna]
MPDRCYVPGCKSGFPDYPKYLGKFTMFSAPMDGKLLKRWNEFIPRKGTLKPSSKFDTLSTENQVWSAANGAITPPDAPEVGVKYRIDMKSNNIKDQTIFFGAKCKPDQGV